MGKMKDQLLRKRVKTAVRKPAPDPCYVVQSSDEYRCETCGMYWEINDNDVVCPKTHKKVSK